ncbi:hypothetical protein AB9P05_00735 [Roseivirga sp. BDSF3-8]|uniref:HNH endonuclease n=1 Tax=Roseivirga sp. BDSF3-8 TaxID=3241598 RepID=UPI0035325B5C
MIQIPLSNKKVVDQHVAMCSSLIKKGLNKINNEGFTYRNKRIESNPNIVSVLEKLQDDEFLQCLISCKPEKIGSISRYVIGKYPKVTSLYDKINRLLKFIFVTNGYNTLSMEQRWDFIQSLNLHTCPYCNRSYTYSLDESKAVKPDIDHFYPKSKYPFLALSFYNLIPSCKSCNSSQIKGVKDPQTENILSPYLINNDSFKFSYRILSIDALSPLERKDKIKVIIYPEDDGNVKAFKLDELYQKHEDHVLELIIKSQLNYAQEYRKYLQHYEGLSFSDTEIDRMIIGNYTQVDELHKRPLSKLYRDIGIELGLIKGD